MWSVFPWLLDGVGVLDYPHTLFIRRSDVVDKLPTYKIPRGGERESKKMEDERMWRPNKHFQFIIILKFIHDTLYVYVKADEHTSHFWRVRRACCFVWPPAEWMLTPREQPAMWGRSSGIPADSVHMVVLCSGRKGVHIYIVYALWWSIHYYYINSRCL